MFTSGIKHPVAFFIAAASVLLCYAQAAEWQPRQNVEIIVGAGAGGGVDNAARTVQGILQDGRLVTSPIVVVNKPGGGQSIALSYLNKHVGNAHYLYMSTATLLNNIVMKRIPHTYRDVTPVAVLFREYPLFVVKADSPIKTGGDLIARLKEDVASVSISVGSGLGNSNHVATVWVAKAANVDPRKIKTVAFKSGGESVTALLGGHIQVAVTITTVVLPQLEEGTLWAIAVPAPQRLGGALARIPTWKEQGIDVVFSTFYIMLGSRDLPQAEVAYWDVVFRKVTETEDWKKSLKANLREDNYLNSEESRKFWEAEHDKLKAILTELGLAR